MPRIQTLPRQPAAIDPRLLDLIVEQIRVRNRMLAYVLSGITAYGLGVFAAFQFGG